MRIAVGGFQHETNTFAPSEATYDEFARGGGWPPLLRGDDMFDGVHGANLPIAGAIAALRRTTHTLLPMVWAAASPCAHVTRDAYERIVGMMLEDVAQAMPLDAIYLDLHGAMVTEHHDDGEGELLARLRALLGPRVPIYASLDLHANVTQRMLQNADALIAYRTYPHVDMADTGERAAAMLLERLAGGARPHCAVRRLPFLIPLNAQCTMLEPAQSVYRSLTQVEGRGNTLSFTPGFPAADFPECGPVVFAYGQDGAAALRAVESLKTMIESIEAEFDYPLYTPEDGVRYAMARSAHARKPIVIADTQDNPGAGGNSDTAGMLKALVALQAQYAALGLMVDPAAARAAHAVGEGSSLNIALGGHSGIPGDSPFHGSFVVERLSEGRFSCSGPFYRGFNMAIGPSACLRIGGVRVVVACEKPQLADQEMFRFIGIEPTTERILVNKSSVHFRADFAPIAEEIILCKAPGPMLADPSEFPWKRLAPGIRLKPNGPAFTG